MSPSGLLHLWFQRFYHSGQPRSSCLVYLDKGYVQNSKCNKYCRSQYGYALLPQVSALFDQQIFCRNWSYSIWWNYIIWLEKPLHFIWKQVYGLETECEARILSSFVQQLYKATPCGEFLGSLRPFWLYGVWNKIKQIPCSFILTWKRFLNDHLGCSFPLLIAVFFHLNYCSASPQKPAEYWPIVRRQSHIEIIVALPRLALFVALAIIRILKTETELNIHMVHLKHMVKYIV